MKRALITGGAGFVGSNLAKRLVNLGVEVVILDNFSTGMRSLVPDGVVSLVEGNVINMDTVVSCSVDCDVIFHLAVTNIVLSAANPYLGYRVNVGGTLNALGAARINGCRMVYASSVSVYGNQFQQPIDESTTPHIMSTYAASKLAGELYCQAFRKMYGVPVSIVRYSNVYGPNQSILNPYCGVVSKFFDACMNGKPMTIYGDGLQTRDYMFVDDAVSATILVSGNDTFNVGTGVETSVIDLSIMIANTCNVKHDTIMVGERSVDGIARRVVDPTKLRDALGWAPWVPLRSGLVMTHRWINESNDA